MAVAGCPLLRGLGPFFCRIDTIAFIRPSEYWKAGSVVTDRPRTLLAAVRPEVQRDIYGFYDRLREADPCYWDRALSAWVVTSHELVSAGAGDPRLSSVRFPDPDAVTGDLQRFATVISRTMLYRDALEHTRLRKAPAAPSRPGPSRRCGR